MDPNNVAQPNTATQPQGQSLDPSVVALTKAIGKAESGGKYDAGDNAGDGASSNGAYQMTPGFLSEWAPKAGIQYQPGAKLNPAQQDQVAYNAVKTMGTEGDPAYPELGKLTPAQITSAWNTGDPHAYLDPEYGKNNTYGSTENYVNKVSEYYNQETGNSGTSQQSSIYAPKSSSPSWLDALLGLGTGAIAGVIGGAKQYGGEALSAGGAALGEVVGGPLGATAGAAIGGGIANDIGLGKSGNNQNSSNGEQAIPQPPAGGFNVENEGNQVEPNKVPTQNYQQANSASQKVQEAIMQAMQGTQTNRNFANSPQGADAIQIASHFGLIEPDENGNLTFNEEKSKQSEEELGNALDSQIKAQDGHASPLSVKNYAGSYIGKNKLATATERQQAAEMVQKEVQARGIGDNGKMSLSDMREAQKQHYASARSSYNNPKSTPHMLAHKALGDAYGRAIRDNLPDKELYDRTKKMQQNLINAKQIGKRLNGKKAPANKGIWESFLRQGARAAEIYIGDKLGGPVGAIIGGLAGDQITRKIEKKFGRNIFETKGMKAALDLLRNTKPKEYDDLVSILEEKGFNIPKDKNKKPTGNEGFIKIIKKDEGRIGKKGLVGTKNIR